MQVTQRQASAWDLRCKGYTYRKIGDEMGLSKQMAHKHTMAAERNLSTNHYKGGESTSEIPLPPHAFKDPNLLDSMVVVQDGAVFRQANWRAKPYNLTEWRIDANLISMCSCTYREFDTTPQAPTAGWCEKCGKWYYGRDVGCEDPEIMHYCW